MSRPILMGNTSCYGKPLVEKVKKEIVNKCISSYKQQISYNTERLGKLTIDDIHNGIEGYYKGMNEALEKCINMITPCDCINDFYRIRNDMNNVCNSTMNKTSDYWQGVNTGFMKGRNAIEFGIDMYRDVLYCRDSEIYGKYVGDKKVCANCSNFLPDKFGRVEHGINREYESVSGQCKYARDVLNLDVRINADDLCLYNAFNENNNEVRCDNCKISDIDNDNKNVDNSETVLIDDSNNLIRIETNQSGNNNIVPKMSKDVFDFMTHNESKNVKECIWKTMQEYESNSKYEYVIYTEKWVYHINNGHFASSINIKGGMQ